MVQAPDWQIVEETLFEQGNIAIRQFMQDYPHTTCSFFAYYADPLTGCFALCLDTPQNAVQQAMKQELFVQRQRQNYLKHWGQASSYINSLRIVEYTSTVDFFQYPWLIQMNFEGWSEFFDSPSYPERITGQDDYLEGNTRIVIWKACQHLIKSKVFLQLPLASPFRVGYQFHEAELVVLSILNWPIKAGKTAYSVFETS